MTKLIAIDGPAGVGKSSVGKAIAQKYNINFFSTGEMYRCLAWKVLESGIDPQDEPAVIKIAKQVKWEYKAQNNILRVYIDGVCPLDKIHNEEVGRAMANNPRTAIGIIDDLHYILVVSDGRTNESQGLSLYELAQVMQQYGCKTAYNLDGGGSSTMYFNGQVINNPTTNGNRISERSVSDIVYIGY